MNARWVFEVVFNEGTTLEQAEAYTEKLREVSKQVGIDLDVHGTAQFFEADIEEAER